MSNMSLTAADADFSRDVNEVMVQLEHSFPNELNGGSDTASCIGNDEQNVDDSQNMSETEFSPEFRVCRKRKRVNQGKTVTRKRKMQTATWIDVKAKTARNSGKSGKGRKGKQIPAKTMGEGCKDTCRFKCKKKISLDERTQIFKEFWALGDHNRQYSRILLWIDDKEPVKSKVDESDSESEHRKKRKVQHVYRLFTSSSKIKVCKTMFLNTLGISHRWIETLDKKKKTEQGRRSLTIDGRGKHKRRPFRVPTYIKNSAREHIESFPTMESHYCRSRSQKKYLQEGLNIIKMYRLYVQHMKEKKLTKIVSQQMYQKIFNYEYNLGFFIPKKDRCVQCETFKNLSENEKAITLEKYEQHIERKRDVREKLKRDKAKSVANESFCTVSFDLQKVLSTPKAEIGPLYYLSKLSVWNFTIYEMTAHLGLCFVWNETIGKRGSNEISSILYAYIEKKQATGTTDFAFYSDNCGGQNRNKNIFSMYIKASEEFQINITHRFLEPGHTWSEVDSVHARIERQCRHKCMFTQQQWCAEMGRAKVQNPYIVTEVQKEDIYDFTELASMFKWTSVQISKIKEISVSADTGDIRIKYNLRKDPEIIDIIKPMYTSENVRSWVMTKAYNEAIPLSVQKKKTSKR